MSPLREVSRDLGMYPLSGVMGDNRAMGLLDPFE